MTARCQCGGKGTYRRSRRGTGSARRSWFLTFCECEVGRAMAAESQKRMVEMVARMRAEEATR